MKKLILLILSLNFLFSSMIYVYTDKTFEKLETIFFIKKEKKYVDKRIWISDTVYEHKYIPIFTYVYGVYTNYHHYTIKCKKQIKFNELKDNFNLLKKYQCKIN